MSERTSAPGVPVVVVGLVRLRRLPSDAATGETSERTRREERVDSHTIPARPALAQQHDGVRGGRPWSSFHAGTAREALDGVLVPIERAGAGFERGPGTRKTVTRTTVAPAAG